MKIYAEAEKIGFSVKTNRYYSDIGLVAPTGRNATKYRDYDHSALRKLAFIRRAQTFRFSIFECREQLDIFEDQKR